MEMIKILKLAHQRLKAQKFKLILLKMAKIDQYEYSKKEEDKIQEEKMVIDNNIH